MKRPQVNQFYEWIKPLAIKDSIDFDFYGFHQKQTEVLFQKEQLKNCSSSEMKHLNLRVLQGEKTGTSYTKDFSKISLENCYKQAVDSLKLSDKKERGDLCKNEKYKDFSAFYDENFKKLSLEDKIKKTQELNSACLNSDKRVQPVYSSVFDLDSYSFFANNEGSQSIYTSNAVSAYCYSLAIQENNRAYGFSEKKVRSYQDIDFKKMGSKSASRALKKLNYSIPKTKRYPVVFQAGEASAKLLMCLANLMSGKSVFEGLSLFKNALGKKVLSEHFFLYDDPLALWGFNSKPFDGEGFAVERTPLVQKGVLENYLTSSFFSKALKVPHTKKAYWINDKGALDISVSNLVMTEGKSPFKELVSEFPQVIAIDDFKSFAGYNIVSGDFSIESEGFLWEKGEARPLCQFTVSGNIKDIFSNILKIGQDSQIHSGTVKAPSFLVPDLMIAGK